jgi:hypothetical protein
LGPAGGRRLDLEDTMRFNLAKLATVGLVLGIGGLGCTVEQVDATPTGTPSGVGGVSTPEAGAGGTVNTGGSVVTGGASGVGGLVAVGGSAPDASDDVLSDAQGECWGDDSSLEAGNLAAACDTLPYAGTDCSGSPPVAMSFCQSYAAVYRPGLFEGMVDCFKDTTKFPVASACDEVAQRTAAQLCSDQITPDVCMVADTSYTEVDGAVYDCAWLETDCPPGDGAVLGITQAQCDNWMSRFTAAHRTAVWQCYLNSPGGATCAADFDACAFPE